MKNLVTILWISLIIFIILFLALHDIEHFYTEKKSYAQFSQDLKVLKHLNNKKNGYFIEVGAANGIDMSNTYLLEKDYNWEGICIEPLEDEFNQLKKNRKAITLRLAVYDKNDEEVEIVKAAGLSGIKDDIDKYDYVKNNESFKIKTKTLTRILDEHNAPNNIDYLSLDTEGSELKILQGIDFDKYKFKYINIEHNFVEPKRTQMKKLLSEKNYKFIEENDVDDIFVPN